jgi:hypothetical protein
MRLNISISVSHSAAILKHLCFFCAFKNICMRKVTEPPRHLINQDESTRILFWLVWSMVVLEEILHRLEVRGASWPMRPPIFCLVW